uniref:Uncharacterized protein n=1 Tax=Aegilops tauschii subsp. strangulata TaxID=200361 RepID=A0A453BLY4_AEGTS
MYSGWSGTAASSGPTSPPEAVHRRFILVFSLTYCFSKAAKSRRTSPPAPLRGAVSPQEHGRCAHHQKRVLGNLKFCTHSGNRSCSFFQSSKQKIYSVQLVLANHVRDTIE